MRLCNNINPPPKKKTTETNLKCKNKNNKHSYHDSAAVITSWHDLCNFAPN